MELKPWFAACRPVRALESYEEGDRVIVLRPRFGGGAWGRRLAGWLGLGAYRIRLDELGTLVWRHCDGRHSAPQIADLLRERFGARVEPAEGRLQRFLMQMHQAKMVVFAVGSRPGGVPEPCEIQPAGMRRGGEE